MRDELIWACFFMLIACASMSKNSDILYAGLLDESYAASDQAKAHADRVASALPSTLPEKLKNLEAQSERVECTNIVGHTHTAQVFGDNGTGTRGGLYALSSKDGSKWDHVVRVFSNNASAEAKSPAIACDTNQYVRVHLNGFRNRIYLAFVMESTPGASSQFSQIFFALSVDGGNLFGMPPTDGSNNWKYYPLRLNVGPNPATNPTITGDDDGDVIVAWTETDPSTGATSTVSRRSSSGGAVFTAPQH